MVRAWGALERKLLVNSYDSTRGIHCVTDLPYHTERAAEAFTTTNPLKFPPGVNQVIRSRTPSPEPVFWRDANGRLPPPRLVALQEPRATKPDTVEVSSSLEDTTASSDNGLASHCSDVASTATTEDVGFESGTEPSSLWQDDASVAPSNVSTFDIARATDYQDTCSWSDVGRRRRGCGTNGGTSKTAPCSKETAPSSVSAFNAADNQETNISSNVGRLCRGRSANGRVARHSRPVLIAECLRRLEDVDPRRVLRLKGIQKLGFFSHRVLRASFEQKIGAVKDVLLTDPGKLASCNRAHQRNRPSGMGYVVMHDVRDALYALSLGEVVVAGATVKVQKFEASGGSLAHTVAMPSGISTPWQ